jgi:hypothetical protein
MVTIGLCGATCYRRWDAAWVWAIPAHASRMRSANLGLTRCLYRGVKCSFPIEPEPMTGRRDDGKSAEQLALVNADAS